MDRVNISLALLSTWKQNTVQGSFNNEAAEAVIRKENYLFFNEVDERKISEPGFSLHGFSKKSIELGPDLRQALCIKMRSGSAEDASDCCERETST